MYGNGYYPQIPQNPYMQAVQPQPIAAKQEVVKVNGENGARAYQMPPNSSALLLDESGLIVWLVVSDGAGYKTTSPYDITPHKTAPAPDYASLEERISKLEGLINANTADTTDARSKPADGSSGSSASAGKRYDPYGSDRKQSNGYASADAR